MSVDSLLWKPQQSWKGLEVDTKSWCSHMTVLHFCKSFDSFSYYKEHIIPILSPRHNQKNLELAKLVCERNWDFRDKNSKLSGGKKEILLIHYDKKWFWGLILREHEKECEKFSIKNIRF